MADVKTLFYTTILFSLKTKWDDTLQFDGCVDGQTLTLNPDRFILLSEPVRMFLVLHEILHVALNHITRMGNRMAMCSIGGQQVTLWNVAGDYVINLMLQDSGHGVPKGGLIDTKFRGMSTEQVYDYLLKHLDHKTGELAGHYGQGDAIGDIQAPGTPTENAEMEQKITGMILRATEITKKASPDYGSIPGEVSRVLENTINPKLPWNVIFQNLLFAHARDDYTWSRPNRRYAPAMYLPSAYSEGMGKFALAVDSSGSVSRDEFAYFIAETAIIHETLKPELISVISFDTELSPIQEVTEATDILNDLEFHGGGGTDISPVLEWAIKNEPEILVIFTDGEFRIPRSTDKYPTCPIIWLIHNNSYFKAPVGDVVHYEL
jgi:predicted metal-dependent peptidase